MTQQEAKTAIHKGFKVTHTYFTDKEYIHLTERGIYFEDGVKVPFDWWNKDYLQTGWRLF